MNSALIESVKIRQLGKEEPIPYDLLLLADPSKAAVDVYIGKSDMYVVEFGKQIIGAYVLCAIDGDSIEIKNIAVSEEYQGQGLGKLLLADGIQKAKDKGFVMIFIGTSNASIGQLYLYQEQGFEIVEIRKNFFLENYSEPIYENGIQCKHMLMLSKQL